MTIAQGPTQLGGAAVLGAAAARTGARAAFSRLDRLPETGGQLIQILAVTGAGMATAGALLMRRGRGATFDAGSSLDD